ncbi:MAG TPA: hypothetical protein VF529_03645 [Solirubrobacteraceae bacterium]|jgi:hypothetical protein
MSPLAFPETLASLMDFLDEEVIVRTGHVHPTGEATLATTIRGTLTFLGEQPIDGPDLTERPVILGCWEHDCTVTIHPNFFEGGYRASDVLTVVMEGVTVEVTRV